MQHKLLYLDVSSNNLTGNVPECLFQGNSTLAVLHLGEYYHTVTTCADQSAAAVCISLLAPLQPHRTAQQHAPLGCMTRYLAAVHILIMLVHTCAICCVLET